MSAQSDSGVNANFISVGTNVALANTNVTSEAGISGGDGFFEMFDVQYFFYGVFMTVIPMIIGFLFAKYVLKLSLLNNLGSLTGGMTSTPALGTLIGTAGTDDVASAYAATYPVALIAVVLVSQFLIILF
jgi:putative transport protein